MHTRYFKNKEFSKNVLTLMTGTTIAQAIPIAISPVLTRIYSPEEFGLAALFISIVSIIGAIVTMRYELAIVQPVEDEDAISLVFLSALIAVVISAVLFISSFAFTAQIAEFLGNKDIGYWLYWVPLAVMVMGFYRSLNYWHSRTKKFGVISNSKVSQGVTTVGTQVGFGTLMAYGGLIYGFILGFLVAFLVLLKNFKKDIKDSSLNYKKLSLLSNAKRYKKLPQYSTWGALADSASLQMPIFVITKFYEASFVGFFSVTFRVLNLPMSLISQALSQVLFQKIAQLHHVEPKKINSLITKLFLILFSMMIPFVGLIWIYGEDLFAFIFGEAWREAGSMASVLVLAVAIRFAVSPLSVVLALDQNIKLGVLWQFIYLVTITATLFIFSSWSIDAFLTAFVCHEITLYLLYFSFILKGSKSIGIT